MQDSLTDLIALCNYLLLGNEDLLRWNLNPHVTPGHHDAIGLRDDLVDVVDSLLVLNLGDDEDVLSLFPENPPDLLDARRIADKGGKDHVDVLLHPKEQVALVLLRDRRKIRVGSWQVAALLRSEVAAVLNLADDIVRADLLSDNLETIDKQ